MTRILAFLLLVLAGSAQAQDYEREKRWAAEILPGLVVGDVVQLKLPSGREFLGLYTEGKPGQRAVLLVHGVGVHPDHGIIGILRASLADRGYTTLSLQMPVQKSDATVDDYYPKVFPEAVARIQAGADWLKGKGHASLVLLSHSMGSWMSNVYYERTSQPPFAAWICMGLTGGFGGMGDVRVPVLDVHGEQDLPQVLRAEGRRRGTLAGITGSRQVKIAGADHHYNGRDRELAAAIVAFLGELK